MHFTSSVVAFLWDSLHMPLSSAHGAGLRLQGSASASHQQPMDKMDKDEAQRNSSMLLPRWTVTKQIHPAWVKCSSCRFGCGVSHVSLLINPHYRSTSRRSLRISLPWYHPDLDEPHPLGCQSPQLELLQAWKRPNKLWILLAPHQKNKYIYIYIIIYKYSIHVQSRVNLNVLYLHAMYIIYIIYEKFWDKLGAEVLKGNPFHFPPVVCNIPTFSGLRIATWPGVWGTDFMTDITVS